MFDSSVAAVLLQRAGYEVLGCFMRLGSPKGVEEEEESCAVPEPSVGAKQKQGCCSVLDAADARRVAGMLDIPFYVLNFQDDFGRVIDYFVGEYNRGRTPNPCVRCNDWLKFGKLAQYAEAVGAEYVASGHYARIGPDHVTGKPTLLRGLDHRKDQSYVLFGDERQNHRPHAPSHRRSGKTRRARDCRGDEAPLSSTSPTARRSASFPTRITRGWSAAAAPMLFMTAKLVTTTGEIVGSHSGSPTFHHRPAQRRRRRAWLSDLRR